MATSKSRFIFYYYPTYLTAGGCPSTHVVHGGQGGHPEATTVGGGPAHHPTVEGLVRPAAVLCGKVGNMNTTLYGQLLYYLLHLFVQ
jgi:hypothetical protein